MNGRARLNKLSVESHVTGLAVKLYVRVECVRGTGKNSTMWDITRTEVWTMCQLVLLAGQQIGVVSHLPRLADALVAANILV
jgi:hypothetical protein